MTDSSGNGRHCTIDGAKWVRVGHLDSSPSGSDGVGKVALKVESAPPPPPPPAVAPFDAAAAKAHQQAWADYLGLPVEKEVELPGGEKMAFMLIPPGEFLMGSSDEERAEWIEVAKRTKSEIDPIIDEGPQHRVRITQPFYLGKYEVTEAQWHSVFGTKPAKFENSPLHPAELASWNDVQPFLARLNASSSADKMKFALPTEAQWEYACRAGTTTAFSFGDREPDMAQSGWFNKNAGGKTHPVGQLRPNGFNLYDMHGNVWEPCADRFVEKYYANSPVDDPTGPVTGSFRVFRGGSWWYSARGCRSACRHKKPGFLGGNLGFRLAASIDAVDAQHVRNSPDDVQSSTSAPPPAVAPFDAAAAKAQQQAWAKHLGEPVVATNSVGMKFVVIPPGRFKMGANENTFDVSLTKPFRLGMHEVTQKQWRSVMKTEPWKGHGQVQIGDDVAATFVNWNDAEEFCRQLTTMERASRRISAAWTYRLPTEAEWEYACRAGTTTKYSFGDDAARLSEYAWVASESDPSAVGRSMARAVGLKKSNAWDLYDLHGNVWEWSADHYAEKLIGDTDPSGPETGDRRSIRGGSWDAYPGDCVTARRGASEPTRRTNAIGFRLVLTMSSTIARAPAGAGSP